ncbi:MAG: hypothetical protein M1836_004797 [Candelina mexicana]|nr:MAG: hypothetical protein M1836_004797 [Candelina mexicana]
MKPGGLSVPIQIQHRLMKAILMTSLTPIKHQRASPEYYGQFSSVNPFCAWLMVIIGLGCIIAVYNRRAEDNYGVTFSVNSWSRVLDAVGNILDTCSPYGGSQDIVGEFTGSLVVYVYEPGAPIDEYLSANLKDSEAIDVHSFRAVELENFVSANEASEQQAPLHRCLDLRLAARFDRVHQDRNPYLQKDLNAAGNIRKQCTPKSLDTLKRMQQLPTRPVPRKGLKRLGAVWKQSGGRISNVDGRFL